MITNLKLQKRKAIQAILTSCDVTHSAGEANVFRETFYQPMKRKICSTALREGIHQILEVSSRSLFVISDILAKILGDTLHDSDASAYKFRQVFSRISQRGYVLCQIFNNIRWSDWRGCEVMTHLIILWMIPTSQRQSFAKFFVYKPRGSVSCQIFDNL